MKKRLIFAGLLLCAAAALLPGRAAAEPEPIGLIELERVTIMPDEWIWGGELVTNGDVEPFDLLGVPFDGSYYNQLDSVSQSLYNRLYADLKDGFPETALMAGKYTCVIDLDQLDRYTVHGAAHTGSAFDTATSDTISALASDTVLGAVNALWSDHPELSWITYVKVDYTAAVTGAQEAIGPQGEALYAAWLARISVSFAAAGNALNTGDKATLDARLAAIKNKLESEPGMTRDMVGKSRYTITKTIHDWICKNVVYQSNEEGHFDQTAYSALVTGKTVCAGYGRAFKVLCDLYEIPCVLVYGDAFKNAGESERHLWNLVQMEDGKWYGVDCTWDDQGWGPLYDFFLTGSSVIDICFGGKHTFSESHLPNGRMAHTEGPAFNYPTMASTKYTPTISAAPTGWTGTYDGAAHGVTLNLTDPVYAETRYRVDGGAYTYTAPSFTEVGTHTVTYEITATDTAANITWTPKTGTVTISIGAPYTVTMTDAGFDLAYTPHGDGVCAVAVYRERAGVRAMTDLRFEEDAERGREVTMTHRGPADSVTIFLLKRDTMAPIKAFTIDLREETE